jgi:hypothetical protein
VATWGALAVAFPTGCDGMPVVTFDVPTGLPEPVLIPVSELVTPSTFGYTTLPAAPQPQASNLSEPRARWRGAGLYLIEVRVDGVPVANAYPPFAATAIVPVYPREEFAFDWRIEHAFSLRAYVEVVPPWQEWDYGALAKLAVGTKPFCYYFPHVLHRHNVYPTDYPNGVRDAYNRAILAEDVNGEFGQWAACEWKAEGDLIATIENTENIHHFAARELFDSPSLAVTCTTPPPAGNGDGTGGTEPAPGTGEPPPPPPPPEPLPVPAPSEPPPPPPEPEPLRAGLPPPSPVSDRSFASVSVTGQALSVQRVAPGPSPGREFPDVLTPRERIEPAYRQFWKQLIVGTKVGGNRVTKLLAASRASLGQRRR